MKGSHLSLVLFFIKAEWYGATAEPARDWPQDGQVTFRDYSTRYRPGLDPVLKKINFEIKAGEKVHSCYF